MWCAGAAFWPVSRVESEPVVFVGKDRAVHGAEQWWVVATGAVGLVLFAGGSLMAAVPPIDAPWADVARHLVRRRIAVLAGSTASVTGAGLLLWPLAAVATSGSADVWPTLALFSVLAWVLGFGFMVLAAVLVAGVAWRGPDEVGEPVARALLGAAHLAVWSVSAPIGAVAVVATTAVGCQAGTFGLVVVVVAAAKVATVGVELAGLARRRGWNAGGWAAGSSGYVTVAWFALVLLAVA
jgi:hypothetical protein